MNWERYQNKQTSRIYDRCAELEVSYEIIEMELDHLKKLIKAYEELPEWVLSHTTVYEGYIQIESLLSYDYAQLSKELVGWEIDKIDNRETYCVVAYKHIEFDVKLYVTYAISQEVL